jgi:glycosyltransferase involved in cell wall biosynthesis
MSRKHTTILFDANPLMGNRTGVGYYTSQLIDALAKAHPETTFVGYYYNFLGRKPRPTTPVGDNITYRPIYHFPGPIINLLRRFGIEVPIEVLTFKRSDFILYVNFLSQPSLLRTPSATVIHDLTFVDLPEYVAQKNLQDLQRFIPRQITRSRFLISVSGFGKRRINEVFKVPLGDILVTPIPPEATHLFNPDEEQRLLEKLGIEGKFILTLGTIEPRKNLLNMLDAYLQLPDEVQKEYAFVSAGQIGWNCEIEIARLAELEKQGKNIIRLGYVDDEERAALYHRATLFTWASHYEGFGMPILEAMSYGTPCAISDIPVFKEVARDAALYFDQQRPEAIKAAWLNILNDPVLHERLSTKSKQRAATYKWSDVAASLYNRFMKTLVS